MSRHVVISCLYKHIMTLQGEEEEGEVYEVLNIRSLKQATPNLRVINMWGVSFVEDAHIEAFSSNCIQLAVLCVSYCPKVKYFNHSNGSTMLYL